MNKNYLFVIIFLVILIGAGAYFVFKIPSTPSSQPSQDTSDSANINSADTSTLGAETSPTPEASSAVTTNMNDKLIIQDEVVGTGAEAVTGKSVTVNYTGTLTDGTVFDSNVDSKFNHIQPFAFNLGAGEVIPGWDQGVVGMKVGGKRKLTIPPSLGYGSQSVGSIPPNSTLIFEIELLKVE
jgi:FKBP-type peptidyl-prolyl cis-trans isomerase